MCECKCETVIGVCRHCFEAQRRCWCWGAVIWEPSPGPMVKSGALRGTGVRLIPIHPVLHSVGPDTINPACISPVTPDPTFTAAAPGPFMPPSCYYLQYLLLLISLLAIVVTLAAFLTDRESQVLSILLLCQPRGLKINKEHYLKVGLNILIHDFSI